MCAINSQRHSVQVGPVDRSSQHFFFIFLSFFLEGGREAVVRRDSNNIKRFF